METSQARHVIAPFRNVELEADLKRCLFFITTLQCCIKRETGINESNDESIKSNESINQTNHPKVCHVGFGSDGVFNATIRKY